ncbi:hypothetical protein [Actinomadura sp. SCN-SB]|uniref:hypothetical protein n=1 Tax=Actinomadura sp. SCN-SB TaxID=3373092 RepID=UPI003753E439
MTSLAAAATFTWLGMVLAISFMEAPLKFRAPGVTIPLGLGIGRLVFRALNAAETVLAVMVVAGLLLGDPSTTGAVALAVAIVTLAAQLALVRPRLTRRSDRILAGEEAPRSHAHHAYIALEAVKVIALVTGGAAVLAAS